MKLIVVSAVNIVEAGPLAILRDCLQALSDYSTDADLRVVALVNSEKLAYFPNIEYIEIKWAKRAWINRLYFEYSYARKLSRKIGCISAWLSLHDTSPRVHAQTQAVYCHNAFIAYDFSIRDLLYRPKIAAFSLLTKCIYKANIEANKWIIVQQKWLARLLEEEFRLPGERFVLFPPCRWTGLQNSADEPAKRDVRVFLFPASPNTHKNFEVICKAAEFLQESAPRNQCTFILTISGTENKYTRWLKKKWGHISSIIFAGFLCKDELFEEYEKADCLIYPSKIESWGLPLSEFSQYGKPILAADLPYAHETLEGVPGCGYFPPDNFRALADCVTKLVSGNFGFLSEESAAPAANTSITEWSSLFDLMLT